MGADLYINSLYERQYAKYEPRFDEAAKLRDSLTEGSAERQRAQEQVEACYEQLYSKGYFRDPYNNWDLLWQFGLSWWNDVLPRLDKEGNLAAADVLWLLAELKVRQDRFEEQIEGLREEDEQHFRQRYAELQEFLSCAIGLNEPIRCSL
jgi:hypothetical protein